jgi:hypothetical protein
VQALTYKLTDSHEIQLTDKALADIAQDRQLGVALLGL